VKDALIVSGFVLVVLVWYVAECAWWPFARCWCCKDGTGKHFRDDGKVWRNCWWCSGSGKRKRVGRKLWDRLT
jgi:hypothetical protein